MKRHRERYAHCFSKNRVIQFVNGGSHRGSQAAKIPKDGSPAFALKQRADASGSANKNAVVVRALKQRADASDSANKNGAAQPRSNPCRVQTKNLGHVVTSKPADILGEIVGRDPEDRRHRLPACPTVERLYKAHAGLAVICADCHHAVIHPNPALPDYFRRQWTVTLLDLERRCRCANCRSRNARLYPWWGS